MKNNYESKWIRYIDYSFLQYYLIITNARGVHESSQVCAYWVVKWRTHGWLRASTNWTEMDFPQVELDLVETQRSSNNWDSNRSSLAVSWSPLDLARSPLDLGRDLNMDDNDFDHRWQRFELRWKGSIRLVRLIF